VSALHATERHNVRQWVKRKVAFVLAATDHGPMIVNRFDYRMIDGTQGYGVGFDLLESSSFSSGEVDLLLSLLDLRRQYFGDGVVAIDCGANIGVHTVEWARKMAGWGSVIAIEAQERVFYALAGNIAINNCFNARAILAAIGKESGSMTVPVLDHTLPSSFGSVELRRSSNTEFVGQAVNYSGRDSSEIPCVTLDSLRLARIDLIKLDIEGMEFEALAGARDVLETTRPILVVEFVKSDKARLRSTLESFGYRIFELRMDLVAVHSSDKALNHIRLTK
jgi:FkbM family methyltransferase